VFFEAMDWFNKVSRMFSRCFGSKRAKKDFGVKKEPFFKAKTML
jgi:hypothetical protein